ncbi:MAG: cupin domain-containing protein [Myxococcota bacterium]|nr:cupin domain-containing protein [Myxococcota bacterium]
MAGLSKKRLGSADEHRRFEGHGGVEIYKLGSDVVMRATFEPGWRWSSDLQPIAGTRSCEVAHSLYVEAGRMRIRMDDGQEEEVSAGDLAVIAPGHNAWVVGDEACVMLDFGDVSRYAQRAPPAPRPEQEARVH